MNKSEMFAVERREAERNEARKLKLFFRFKDKTERDDVLKNIAELRSFHDEFNRMIDFRVDSDPSHADDGIELRFDEYDSQLFARVKTYLNNQGFEIVGADEWIVEPEEQNKMQSEMMGNSSQKKVTVIDVPQYKKNPPGISLDDDERIAA